MSVFITGASSGIGEACAKAFAGAGQDLVLVARRTARLERLAGEVRKDHSVGITLLPIDVREKGAVARWVEENGALASRVSVLVNNAGLARGLDPIQTGDPSDWDEMIDTNIKGLLYTSRALFPALIANRGHVVNLGSVAGRWTYPKGNVYSATKFAVSALSESMRLDLHGTGVRVTNIEPGMVETEFSEVRFKGDREKAKGVYTGLEALEARDIADAVLWSVQRPRHVNVQELVLFPVDQASVTLVKRTP